MKTLLAFLLHAANRNIKGKSEIFINAFYKIKDLILTKHGKIEGYDVQHIRGKKCNSCGGTGQHPKYGHNGKIYDYADCYHCFGGWYKFPIWVCLNRIYFKGYTFHKPLKREEHIGNPFTKESLGWEVTDRPVIQGYIEHNEHKFGGYAIFILLWMYDRNIGKMYFNDEFRWWRQKLFWRFQRVKIWDLITIEKPALSRNFYYDEQFQQESDLPF